MTAPSPAPKQLRRRQAQRESAERARAAAAETPEARRAADRRADKAAYLRERVDEQVRADNER